MSRRSVPPFPDMPSNRVRSARLEAGQGSLSRQTRQEILLPGLFLEANLSELFLFRRLAVPALGGAPYVTAMSTILPQAKRIVIVN